MCGAVTPKSRAMVGKAVASTVPSSCSMNIALATMSAIVRKLTLLGSTDALGATGCDVMVNGSPPQGGLASDERIGKRPHSRPWDIQSIGAFTADQRWKEPPQITVANCAGPRRLVQLLRFRPR